ncbi:imm11 family protein [Archangium violaceum]|uniref:imm11 family protein n=1 Tax=Archangium violaceum TaxID=83451 RepID=UPI0035E3D4D1
MTGYFELQSNMRIPGRWVLKSPRDEHGQEVDPWQFSESRVLSFQSELRLPVSLPGRELDFSLTGLGVVVVHDRVVHLFTRMGIEGVQFIPAHVDGHSGPYFILNALRIIRCIDDARSEEVRYWKPEDGQPDKVGEYRVVAGMRIDPSKVGDARVFRPWGWPVALLISEDLKQAMEAEGITGTRFVEV